MFDDYTISIIDVASVSHSTLDIGKFEIMQGLGYGLGIMTTDSTYKNVYANTGAAIKYTLTAK